MKIFVFVCVAILTAGGLLGLRNLYRKKPTDDWKEYMMLIDATYKKEVDARSDDEYDVCADADPNPDFNYTAYAVY